MSVTRSLLDCLGRDSLVRLIYGRGLPTSRENDERRETLARSYRGDVEALIDDLSQADLVDVFRQMMFEIDGVEHYLSNPPKYRRDELRAFAIRAFSGRPVQVVADFQRVTDDEDLDVAPPTKRKATVGYDARPVLVCDVPNPNPEGDDFHDTIQAILDEKPSTMGELREIIARDYEQTTKEFMVTLDSLRSDGVIKVDVVLTEEEAADDDADVNASNESAFASLSKEWSRPRKVARVLRQLGERAPERLRSERFQQLVRHLGEMRVEICLADDPSCSVLTDTHDSPGIAARLRLRLITSDESSVANGTSVEQEIDLSTADELLIDEKVATLSLRRDPRCLYVIKNGEVWAVPRHAASEHKVKARRVATTGVEMDHSRYVYYLDADGDLARKERGVVTTPIPPDDQLSLLGWAVIHSDGVVDPREVAELKRVLGDAGGIEQHGAHDLSAIEAALEVASRASTATKQNLLKKLFAIATSDGVLADEELKLLSTIESRLLPGSNEIALLVEEWRQASQPPAMPVARGEQLIDDILSILQGSAQ